jgi:hypothetical protein
MILPEYQRVREMDRERYHPENPADYTDVVGIEGPDGNRYCVGCAWCTEAPSEENQRRIAFILGAAG